MFKTKHPYQPIKAKSLQAYDKFLIFKRNYTHLCYYKPILLKDLKVNCISACIIRTTDKDPWYSYTTKRKIILMREDVVYRINV